MRILIAAALLAGPDAAQPPTAFCTDIRRIAAAAEEQPSFSGLAGTGLHALLESYCVVPAKAVSFLCTRSLSPRHITAEAIAARMVQCLPGAALFRRPGFRSDLMVRHGRLQVDIAEHGSERAHVGRSVVLYFKAVPPGP